MRLIKGDCLQVMDELIAQGVKVDAIITDPPYGISFMGKGWDKGVPSAEVWEKCIKLLKPGGHLLSFAGTRTQHKMVTNIEDAGFEIRDMIAWVYGSGFPKSLDVSKAIDKAAGAEREVVGQHARTDLVKGKAGFRNLTDKLEPRGAIDITTPATPEAQQWDGWGTALKPALEPITVARKPLTGTVAANVLEHGTGAINVDGCRVGNTVETWPASRSYAPGQIQPGGKGKTQSTGAVPAGRWPANLIHDGSDEVVRLFPQSIARPVRPENIGKSGTGNHTASEWAIGGKVTSGYYDTGTSAARFFYCAKASKRDRDEGCEGIQKKQVGTYAQDEWSRKNMGNTPDAVREGRANNHPTVKPTDLMRYLVRLVTPPGGTVLDPFMGSGSTGKAAKLEGFDFIGIELDEKYFNIAKARIEQAEKEKASVLI